MQRRVSVTLLLALCLVVAGCSGGTGPAPTTDVTDADTGTTTDSTADDGTADTGGTAATTSVVVRRIDDGVNFYVSDQENAIDDFAYLNVTIDRVGFQRAGGGWVEREVSGRTVDLTELKGANATRLTNVDVPNGTYNKVFAYVSDVNATLDDGTETRVKLPSEKLQLQKSFTVGANTSVDFVFDIAVHKAGKSGKYILRPVVSQSGTDVPIREVDAPGELNASFVGNVTRGGNATLEVTRSGDPVPNATVAVDDEQVGTTDADGRLTVSVPDREEFELTIAADGDEAELEVEFEEREEDDEDDRDEQAEDEGEEGDTENEDADDRDETEEDENEEADDGDEREEGEDDEDTEVGAGELNASFVGNVTRGGNVTVAVTRNGSAVANATVTVNDEPAGETDAGGELTFSVPDEETLTVEVTAGEDEAELEVEFEERADETDEADEDDGDDDDDDEN